MMAAHVCSSLSIGFYTGPGCQLPRRPRDLLANILPAATIYQNNTTSDTCSGAAYVAYISECYNTSWAYYSIDECTPLTSGSSSSSSSASGSTSDSTSATGSGISGGAIAGAIVGSVCGLGIIAATCVYLFWFRPRQKEREKRERQDAGVAAAAEAEVRRREEEEFRAGTKPHELQQQPPELHSPGGTAELPVERVFEAPGDRGAVEVGGAAQLPVELPGDQLDWGLDSDEIKEDGRKYRL